MGISDKVAGHLQALLGEQADETAPGAMRTMVDDAHGGTLGPYQLEAVIGAGGMGTVYRALDPTTGKPVALKVPHAGAFPFSSRFERESWFAHSLGQMGDAPYLDHGVTSSGTPFLAMPLLEGQSLRELSRQRQLTPSEVLRIGERLSHVLAGIHRRGLVHRDVKPENVLIDEQNTVWLLDHGLTGAPGTLRGAGTPAYAAPEQLEGGDVAPSADVYALGVLMLELWIGEPVYASVLARVDAVGARQLEAKLERVELPGARALLQRMLAWEPSLRPANGAHAARAVARLRSRGQLVTGGLEARVMGPTGAAMLGREAELAELQRRVAAHGEAWVVGAPGIGKSRLIVAWWQTWASLTATLAWPEARLSMVPMAPYDLARGWLEAAAGLTGAEAIEARQIAVMELAEMLTDSTTAAQLMTPHRSPESWLAVLAALGRGGPLVLVTDHAHPPDRESLALIGLCREHAGCDVIAIHEAVRAPHDTHVVVGPLAPEAMDSLASQTSPSAAHAVRFAQGNPLAFMMLSRGEATAQDEAIAEQLQRLDPYARWLLRLASLRGVVFRAEDILPVAGSCDGPMVRDGLARLVEAGWLVDLTSVLGVGAGTYRMAHRLVAEVARSTWQSGALALGTKLFGHQH